MAGNNIRISTDQVRQIAGEMQTAERQLIAELDKCENLFLGRLKNTWSGEAANETIHNFIGFKNNWEQRYKTVLDQYIKFLNDTVAQGYEATETHNQGVAASFK